jgi:predicted O-linked N-acetylglucosamine transferase (SPINDLY family)
MQGSPKEAIGYFVKAIKVNAAHHLVHFNLAKALSDNGDDVAALKHHITATQLEPAHAETWLNYGKSLSKLAKFQEAIQQYNQALQVNPNLMEALSNKGAALNDLGLFEEGLACIDRAITINADHAQTWSNRALALEGLRRFQEALVSYDHALKINPSYVVAWVNKGATFAELKQYEDALTCYDQAICLQPDYVDAWSNKAEVLDELKRFDEALDCYKQAITRDPNFDYLYGQYIHCKMMVCEWSNLDSELQRFEELIRIGRRTVNPFIALGLFDQPDLQQLCAATYTKHKFGSASANKPHAHRDDRIKIRIAYFSSDFRNHPVSYLVAELIELHNRDRFEVFGFSSGPDVKDEMQQRLLNAFDQLIEVGSKSPSEVVQLCNTLAIDVAIDLGGYTAMARPELFAQRVAPVQIGYLGFIGTSGSQFMDYLIADDVVIPRDRTADISEKIIYLPNCYQVSDSKRQVSDREFSRTELGLPAKGFVFCCFNNSYKIHPSTFASWMRILKQVEGSVLWLLQDNPFMVENLKREALAQGIASERLVFAGRVSYADYLARFKAADLFLDTLPYNAGTTANDALFAGVPVLTAQGRSFVSRMASSLLHALHLDELVVSSYAAYESQAIALAQDPMQLSQIKTKLAAAHKSAPLFDTASTTKQIEAAYEKIVQRSQAGLPPETIHIDNVNSGLAS